MPFTVVRPGVPPLHVDADDHRVEGGWHVFRRDAVVLGRPRSVVVLRLPADATTGVSLAAGALGVHADVMTSRYEVSLEQLEEQSRIAATAQVQMQAEPRLHEPLVAGPQLHPYGDGATGADGDGE